MKWNALMAVSALTLAANTSAFALPKEITIATEGAYPPWNYVLPDGTLGGYEIELAEVLCQRIAVKCKIISQEWNGIIPGLRVGKYDAIMASVGLTEQRARVVDFSVPYSASPNGFLVRKNDDLSDLGFEDLSFDLSASDLDGANQAISKLEQEFQGKTLGAQTGSTAASFIDQYFKNLDVRLYPTFEQLSLELNAGRIDVAVASVTTFKNVFESKDGANLKMSGPVFKGGVAGSGTAHVVVRKGKNDLKEAFNNAIVEINQDGTNAELTKKWFGVDISIKSS